MSLRTRLLAGMAFIAVVLVVVAVLITITTRDHLIGPGRRAAAGSVALGRPGGRPRPAEPTHRPSRVSVPSGSPVDRSRRTGSATCTRGRRHGRDPVHVVRPERRRRRDRRARLSRRRPADAGRTVVHRRRRRQRRHLPRARRAVSTTASTITAVLIDDEQSTIQRLIVVEVLGVVAILDRARRRDVVDAPARHPPRQGDDADRDPDRRRRPVGARARSGPGTEPGELAVALNSMLGRIETARRRAGASEDACASSSPTHPTSCARRSRRSVATPSSTATAGWRPTTSSPTRCAAPSRRRRGWADSSTTCWCSPSSISSARSTPGRSTWRRSPRRRRRRPRRPRPQRDISVEITTRVADRASATRTGCGR